jgi:transcriptional regulator
MGNNTPKLIRERREKILLLMARGYNQMDIAKELGITRMTINRDMKYINEMINRGLFDRAKTTFATMYFNCVDGYDEILKECWKIYNSTDLRITQWHKIAALRLASDIQEHKFSMFQNGPAIMYLGKLHDKVEEIRRMASEDRNDKFTKSLPSPSPYKDFDVRDLDKP